MKTKTSLLILTVFVLGGCAPTNYPAASGKEKAIERSRLVKHQARVKNDKVSILTERVETLEKVIRQQKADQSVLLEDLRVETKTLRGNLDVLRFDLKSLTEKSNRVNESFDDRLTEMEKGRKPVSKERAVRSTKQTQSMTGVDDITRYNEILRRILDKKDYDTSIAQFREFIKNYPDSRYAANAQYWIGEGFFAKSDYAKAIVEFQKVLDKYPNHEKGCDALLKQGISFREMKETSKARLFLSEVPRKCPDTKTATRAKQELSSLSQ